MKKDTMPRVAAYWNQIAGEFDAIYTGDKSAAGRILDRWLRRDMYQRFDWVMRECGDVSGRSICDIGCGSGRFVAEFARRGAAHVTGVDVAPEMLKLARRLVQEDGVAAVCDFVHADVLDWNTDQSYDITIAIGFWDYIADPLGRLEKIRGLTRTRFLSAWPRFWTWRMPVRKVRLHYMRGCPVYFFRLPEVRRMIGQAGFRVENCIRLGKLFCVDARPI